MNFRRLSIAAALLIGSICPPRAEEGLVAYKSLSPELALDLARAALDSCRARGYQVAVAVVDRFGVTQVMLRDRFAGPHTPSTATGKAWTAATFKTSTTELNAISQPGMMQAALWSERSAYPALRAVTRTKRAREPELRLYVTSWSFEETSRSRLERYQPFRELGGRRIRRDEQPCRSRMPTCGRSSTEYDNLRSVAPTLEVRPLSFPNDCSR